MKVHACSPGRGQVLQEGVAGDLGQLAGRRGAAGWLLGEAFLPNVNLVTIPLAAGALSAFGLTMRPEVGAACMAASSLLVVTNALRLRN